MENWEKIILRDLIKFIIEEEERYTLKIKELEKLGITIESKIGTGKLALERLAANTNNQAINCNDFEWWLNLYEFIYPKYFK